MKLSYDPEVDALYIELVEEKSECRTLRLSDEIALDIEPNEMLLGIEILEVKQVLGKGEVPTVVLKNLKVAQPEAA